MIHGHSLQLADIDGDGNLDIFAAEMAKWREQKTEPDHPDATAWVLYGVGQGHFRTSIFSKGIDFHDARVAELDGDGDLDILDKPYNLEGASRRCLDQRGPVTDGPDSLAGLAPRDENCLSQAAAC